MVYVYGGSFNPPTLAHKRIVETVINQDPDCKVIVIPVGNDYNKKGLIDVAHRIKMLERMFFGLNQVMISNLEVERAYEGTLATLEELSKTYDELTCIIGSDQLTNITSWIKYEELLKKYPFVIMMRNDMYPDDAEYYVQGLDHDFSYIQFDHPAASTDIRLKKYGYEKHLDPSVLAYINENHLYEE